MKMKKLLLLAFLALFASTASAVTYTYGWEDGVNTVLETYPAGGAGAMICTNVSSPEPIFAGAHALKCVDDRPSSTPQGFVAWIRGLQDGDDVYASIMCYDDTEGASPSGRLWAHWNDDPLDVTGYDGSDGVGSDYSDGLGWSLLDYTYTAHSGHTGMVIEVRTYSAIGDTAWYDNLAITVPDRDGIEVEFAGGYVAVEGATISSIKALY